MDTVKIRVSSMLNISFDHVVDTKISQSDWDEMDGRDRVESVTEVIFDKVISWDVES